MGDAPDFVLMFHNLEGDLLGQRKKNFNNLIRNSSSLFNKQQLDDVLSKLKPKNYQERLFQIEALLYFERTEELLEILKEGHPIFANKILKQARFIEEAFKNVEGNALVNDFFPYLSYRVRKKLLNGISKCWGEAKMDGLFTAMDNRYGLAAATEILHACSPQKIIAVLEENEIKLRPNQVIKLFNKSKEVLKVYLNNYYKITKTKYKENKVLNCVALKDPPFLLDLEKEEIIKINKIGRRTTKKIINTSKDDISADFKRYVNILNKTVFVRKFSPDFKIVYKQIFPSTFAELEDFNVLNYYPKKRRWELFLTTCKEKYSNKSMSDIFLSLDMELKNLYPPQDIIHQWAETFYQKRYWNSDDYLKYYPTSKAVPIIKQKINVTSKNNKRTNLLNLLVLTCLENKDLDALEEIFEYLSLKHKNEEDEGFRHSICCDLNTYEVLGDMNENHWKYINEHIEILLKQKPFLYHDLAKTVHRYIEYLFKNGKDYGTALVGYLNGLKSNNFFHDLVIENLSLDKDIYSEMCRIFPNVVTEESKDYNDIYDMFIVKVIKFCLNNKDHCINLSCYPHIIAHVEKIFNKTKQISWSATESILIYNETFPQYKIHIETSKIISKILFITKEGNKCAWWLGRIFDRIVKKKDRSALGNEILKCYMEEIFVEYPDESNVLWFLKNEPKTIEPYFDTILKGILNYIGNRYLANPLNYGILRNYSHLNFDTKARDFFTQQLNVVNKNSITLIRPIEYLAALLPTSDFVNIIEERYLPKKEKLDLEDDEMRQIYKTQCSIANILGRVLEPYKMLPTIMKFVKGDYLQSALPALYCAFYNSPQRILYSYVKQMEKQAVSVRKHALFLSCAVLDKEYTMDLLQTTKQSNISSQKHLFSATLKYFLKNPCQDLFGKTMENMSNIDKHDKESLDNLIIVNIPTKYRQKYIENCWYFIENFEFSDLERSEYLEKLVEHICEKIETSLSPDFVNHVVTRYFPIQTKKRLKCIDRFVVNVLRKQNSERIQNFNLVFEMLSKFNKQLIHRFFHSFLSVARKQLDDKEFIRLFYDHWNKNFTIAETLEEHVALRILLLRVDNRDVVNLAHALVNYMNQFMLELGFVVFSIFKNQLIDALDGFDLKYKLTLYSSVLQHKMDSNTCVLIIQLLEDVDEDDQEIKTAHMNITNMLKNVDIPIVKAYCKSYFEY